MPEYRQALIKAEMRAENNDQTAEQNTDSADFVNLL